MYSCCRPVIRRTVRQSRRWARPPRDHEFLSPVGHFSGVPLARQILELPAASQYELAQAIPPAYSEFIGRQILAEV